MSEADVTSHKKSGKMIAICGAKGGVGRTLLAVNLAVGMSKKNLSVAMIDGDLQFGDISLALNVKPSFTIKDVMESIERLDQESLVNYLTVHSSGVTILPAPERPEFAELVTPEALLKISDLLLQENQYVVVDTGVGIQSQTIDVIEKADQILVVTNLEMATLKNTKLMIEVFGQLGVREKVRLVVNQYNLESVVKVEDAVKMLEIKSLGQIPSNTKIASTSMNMGIPFVLGQANSDIAKAVFKLAETIISEQIVYNHKLKKQSFFKKLLLKGK